MADIIYPGDPAESTVGSSMLPNNVDLAFWKGDAVDFVVRLKDAQGAAVVVTGQTPAAVVKSSFNSSTSYNFTTTVQNGNEIRVYLPSSVSKTIPAGEYIWNLQLTQTNGDVRTYLAGDVTVYAEVD